MRLFVAVVPPPEAVTHLAGQLDAARADPALALDELRWARPETWHLTLAFLGELDDGRVPELRRRLDRAAARHPACRVALEGAGRFDGRVLWVGFTGDRAGLRRLAASVQAGARRAGAGVDERPLRAHLTLARAREQVDLRPAVAALTDYTGPPWIVSEALLVRSRLGAGPGRTAVHEVVSRHPLAPARAARGRE